MTALSADRLTAHADGEFFTYPVLAAAKIYEGSIVVLDSSGYAKPGVTATGLIAAGVAVAQADNTNGNSGDIKVKVVRKTAYFANGDSIGIDSIGDFAYIVDDQTVAKGSSGKSVAGLIVDVSTADGVKIDFRAQPSSQAGLLAANNLSDVGSTATAAHNLGLGTADTPSFTGHVDTQVATKTTTYGVLLADSGSLLQSATDGQVFNLPASNSTNKGMEVVIQNTAADGGALIKIEPNGTDTINGQIGSVEFGSVASKGIWNTKATQKKGDFARVKADGSGKWWVIGGVGVWASEA